MIGSLIVDLSRNNISRVDGVVASGNVNLSSNAVGLMEVEHDLKDFI